MKTIPSGTQFAGIAPEIDVNKRSELINTDIQRVYTLDDIKGYRYVARLSQTGTAAPTASVAENGLGKTITWARTSAGVYTGTVSGGWGGVVIAQAFNFSKTSNSDVVVTSTTSTTIVVTTSTFTTSWAVADAILNATPIIIQVYPAI
jgi:uncharacterized membrane protein YfcA